MSSRRNKIFDGWDPNLAYAIGLMTADGCLSSDGRHLEFTSKDKIQVQNFKKCLGLDNKITKKTRAQETVKKYYRVQFGSVTFYEFLEGIGLSSRKSLTLKKVRVPDEYFADFLRGLFDGDGNFSQVEHPESKHPQIRFKIASASHDFLEWLHEKIQQHLEVQGYITPANRCEYLAFGKEDTFKIVPYIYYDKGIICLPRKRQKINKSLSERV